MLVPLIFEGTSSNMQAGDDDLSIVHSIESWDECLVDFVNCTSGNISLEWLDFQGNHVRYADCLPSMHSIKISTYVGHPWVVYEERYRHKRCFNLQREQVYYPGPPSPPHDLQFGIHSCVPILTPMKSLQDCCLELIHTALHSEADVERLPVHPMFKRKLGSYFNSQRNLNLKIRKVKDNCEWFTSPSDRSVMIIIYLIA